MMIPCRIHPEPTPSPVRTRSDLFLSAAAEAGAAWFSPDGAWTAPFFPLSARGRFWLSFAFYRSGRPELADTIIRKSDTDNSREQRRPSSFNIFHTNIAAGLLASHHDAMAADVRWMLEALVREGFATLAGNRQPDYQFHGYNDNMPAKASMGLILGGERLGNADAVEHGLWNLRHFAAQLTRRGINSEFNSPTYTPLTIHAMAEIARHARNPEARELARAIEARLWIDLASRFHPATGLVAGPYSRAYTVDLAGHFSCLASLLWFVIGDRARPSPMGLFDPDRSEAGARSKMVLHHRGNVPFNVAQMGWFAAGEYHLPPEARSLFSTGKAIPASSVATAEMGDAGDDFPARPVRVETWMDGEFAVGTSSSPFLGGDQAAPWFVTYAKAAQARSIRDTGTVFWKFLAGDAVPGRIAREHSEYENKGEEDNVPSHGGAVTMQAEATALLLSHPSPRGEDAPDSSGNTPALSRLSEAVVFSSHFGGADEIMVAGESRGRWSGACGNGVWIGCRRGNFLTAIRPLAYTRGWGRPAITLEQSGHYELLRTTFYHGEPRSFSRDELRWIFGGFVAEHGSLEAYGSLADFMREVERGRFTDYFWTTRRVRYERPQGKILPPLTMDISWSPGSTQPRHALINDRLIGWPRTAISGIADDRLPLTGSKGQPVPGHLPWEKLVCAQADWPAIVGERARP